jgi:hypothetical protein
MDTNTGKRKVKVCQGRTEIDLAHYHFQGSKDMIGQFTKGGTSQIQGTYDSDGGDGNHETEDISMDTDTEKRKAKVCQDHTVL